MALISTQSEAKINGKGKKMERVFGAPPDVPSSFRRADYISAMAPSPSLTDI